MDLRIPGSGGGPGVLGVGVQSEGDRDAHRGSDQHPYDCPDPNTCSYGNAYQGGNFCSHHRSYRHRRRANGHTHSHEGSRGNPDAHGDAASGQS